MNFAIRRRALIELGGFHPDLVPKHLQHFQGDGETGLTRKANEAGYRAVYNPQAFVFHHVPQRRMTLESFEERYFYQGVCDSYTCVRGGVPELRDGGLDVRLERLKSLAKSSFRPMGRWVRMYAKRLERRALQQRFQRAYRQGFEFHQDALRRNPVLLDWVLNYRLPILPSGGLT